MDYSSSMTAAGRVVALALAGLFMLPLAALAKRKPAPVIPPVVHEGVRYTVPNDKGTVGYVVARDVATGKELWRKTIFRKRIFPLIEHDFQWVFLKNMRREGERLIFTDEREKTYSLDLKTRKVKKLKTPPQARPGPTKVNRASPGIEDSFHGRPPWQEMAKAERHA